MIAPMRYPGGKGKCFQHIINVLPKHHTYIETHVGGGAVLRHKAPAEESLAIDINPKVISWWRKHHPTLANFVVGNASEILTSYRFTGSEVVYCDPPYLPCTRKRSRVYTNDLTEKEHLELLFILKRLPCRVAISGYPSKLYAAQLCDWNQLQFAAKGHDGVHIENLWFNYTIPEELHDARFLGVDFRQRQNVKRRLARLHNRISRLSGQEQHALSRWLLDQLSTKSEPRCSISHC
jgi:DNA adenine methylase